MYAKAFVLALLPLLAVNVNAMIYDKRAPAPGLLGDFFSSVTHGVASKFGEATHAVGEGFDIAGAEVTATSLYRDATVILGTATTQAYATVTTISSMPVVEITSVGGPAITLATGSGMLTSFVGHTFTAAVPSSTSSSASSSSASASASASKSAAGSVRPLALSGPMLASAATVVGSMIVGVLVA